VNSKMEASCLECGYTANRSEFYKRLRSVSPTFEDTCPKCLGDDVDVYMPGVSFAAVEDA